MYLTLEDGRKLPVGAGVMPVCGFDGDGNPASGATEATLDDQRKKAFGLNGGAYVANTTAQAGSFVAIMALEDAVIASMTAENITGALTNIPLPAGAVIYGTITVFTLASGKIIAYNA